MSVTISRKLSNSFEGALGGGGDPASSPLYVFGPFLKLIVVAGVAQVTFGASVWMAIFSVVVVSAMYRQVMGWITDGSGGSGLSEEEFGSWAVKITAGITVIEYILTYLVSMAAMVTFIADRFPMLNNGIGGMSYRVILAVILTFFSCWVTNLGPKVSARIFGPATGAVLLLLWAMIAATIYSMGFHLPDLNMQAFSLAPVHFTGAHGTEETSTYLNLTFGGYARILALMTGIEIFANLVAAYDGTRAERSKKAFGSLMIIMGTTAITMLIVGPAILAHSDPRNEHVSVFTQTMDFLFPAWLSYVGTLIGVAVLLSAAAAAAQGVQNLALGLRYRHYVHAKIGQRNKHDVADLPVWIMAVVCSICFLLFGTKEDTYLALYAAGVFILLSMTGWAASKRLLRELRLKFTKAKAATLFGTIISATLTTFATVVIFEERFFEGAWSYLIMMPLFYLIFNYYRSHLGPPPSVEDRLGRIVSGQGYVPQIIPVKNSEETFFRKVLICLDGAPLSEKILPMLRFLALPGGAEIELLLVSNEMSFAMSDRLDYLSNISKTLVAAGFPTNYKSAQGDPASQIDRRALSTQADLIILTADEDSAVSKLLSDSEARHIVKRTLIPILVVNATEEEDRNYTHFKRILVALDGSEASESVLPYIHTLARGEGCHVLLLSVPEGSESENYCHTIQHYLSDIAAQLNKAGIETSTSITGSGPSRTILGTAEAENSDLIMMASHGRGGIDRPKVHLGSVTEKVMQEAHCPMFIVPLTKSRG